VATIYLEPGRPVDLLIDTGSNQTILPAEAAVRLHPTAATVSTHASVRNEADLTMLLLPELRLGSFREPNVVVLAEERSGEPLTVGTALLSRFRVTFDFQARA